MLFTVKSGSILCCPIVWGKIREIAEIDISHPHRKRIALSVFAGKLKKLCSQKDLGEILDSSRASSDGYKHYEMI